MNSKKYLSSVEAAALLQVSPVTVRQWAQKGLLASASTAGGHRRFLRDEVKRFAAEHGIHVEEDERAPAEGTGLRVLIVEDDPVFSAYVREIIAQARPDARIEQAADGFEAGQLTEKLRPALVVLDIHMPRINGIELCARLRASATTAASRLVVLSAALNEDNAAAARRAGADACIPKGASREAILRALDLKR